MIINWKGSSARTQDAAHAPSAEDEQLRQKLLDEGARLHASLVERSDDCSLAVLDRAGVVVSWYDETSNVECNDERVLHRHMSQFYMPRDIAAGIPHRGLRFAALSGFNTQHGWRRRPSSTVYWGTTILETIEDGDGRALGFAHATRRSRGPWELGRLTARTHLQRPRTRMRWTAPRTEPAFAAL